MKKILALILVTAFIVTSCRTYESDKSVQEYTNEPIHLGMTGTMDDHVLYYTMIWNPGFMYYADLYNHEYGVLCGKPECTHNTGDCNGYLGEDDSDIAMILGVSVVGDELFYILNDGIRYSVYKMKKDGSSHKKIRDLAAVEDNTFPSSGGLQPIVYGNYVLAAGNVSIAAGGEFQTICKLMAYPLNSEEEIEVFSERVDFDYGNLLMMPKGDTVYYAVSKTNIKDEEMISELELKRWDISENKNEDLYNGSAPDGLYEWCFQGNHLFFTGTVDNRLYELDLEKGIFISNGAFGGQDSGFMTENISGSYVIGFQYPDAGHIRIRVEDIKGNVVSDKLYDRLTIQQGAAGRTFVGMKGNNLYFIYMNQLTESGSLIECNIEKGTQTELWTVMSGL